MENVLINSYAAAKLLQAFQNNKQAAIEYPSSVLAAEDDGGGGGGGGGNDKNMYFDYYLKTLIVPICSLTIMLQFIRNGFFIILIVVAFIIHVLIINNVKLLKKHV